MNRSARPILEDPIKLVVILCSLLAAAAGALALVQRHDLIAELEQESTALYRLASQRADQHDAHLTALSAIAVAGQGERHDLFLDIAATISRFYSRIDEVQLVPYILSRALYSNIPSRQSLSPRRKSDLRES